MVEFRNIILGICFGVSHIVSILFKLMIGLMTLLWMLEEGFITAGGFDAKFWFLSMLIWAIFPAWVFPLMEKDFQKTKKKRDKNFKEKWKGTLG